MTHLLTWNRYLSDAQVAYLQGKITSIDPEVTVYGPITGDNTARGWISAPDWYGDSGYSSRRHEIVSLANKYLDYLSDQDAQVQLRKAKKLIGRSWSLTMQRFDHGTYRIVVVKAKGAWPGGEMPVNTAARIATFLHGEYQDNTVTFRA